jgi:hypothetical protein
VLLLGRLAPDDAAEYLRLHLTPVRRHEDLRGMADDLLGGIAVSSAAAGFQLLITPSRVEPMIAACVDARIAVSSSTGAAARSCLVTLGMCPPWPLVETSAE